MALVVIYAACVRSPAPRRDLLLRLALANVVGARFCVRSHVAQRRTMLDASFSARRRSTSSLQRAIQRATDLLTSDSFASAPAVREQGGFCDWNISYCTITRIESRRPPTGAPSIEYRANT